MSTKIAPAPPPLIQGLPRIAFLPNQTPVLLIPTAGSSNRVHALPIRVAPANDRPTTYLVQQKRPIVDEVSNPEESGSSDLPSTQQRREYLKRKIQERPSKQFLLRQHILHADPRVEPFVGEKTHQLRKQAVVSNLNRKLKSRPGPLDLVTKKILQADAELEEAIKEGRLLFPSSRRELESPSPSTPQAPSPSVLLSSLRISKQASAFQSSETIKEEDETRTSDSDMMEGDEAEDHRARKYGRVERTQQHPYARMDMQASPSKSRLKGPDSKSAGEYTVIPDNYEAMMKQQELFIEWRGRPEGNGVGHNQHSHQHLRQHSQPVEEGGDSDSGETIPYGDEDGETTTTTITYKVYPEQPAETVETIIPTPVTKVAPVLRQSIYRTPIYSLSDIKKTDLMQECRIRGMKCGGDKTAIILRLDSVKDDIISKYKEEQARVDPSIDSSPQISSERALSNTSSSSSPSTIIEEMVYDNGSVGRIDESITSRRYSLPSSNMQQAPPRSVNPPTRHLSMSSSTPSQSATVPSIPSISSLSFTQGNQLNPNMHNERRIQMKTANGEIFYATLPSADELPIPRDGKPIGCKIAIVNGKPVLQFQQPSGPIEPGSVGVAGIRDTLLFASNGSGGQVTLGPQKERARSSSLHRKVPFSGDCTSISSLLRGNSSQTSMPVVVQRAPHPRSQSTSSNSGVPKQTPKSHVPLPRENRKSRSPPQAPPPKEVSVQPEEQRTEEEVIEEDHEESLRGLTDAQRVFAHVKAINRLLERNGRTTLDAKTVLEHEHALRSQQRIVDQLAKELKKSQTALKLQQQLIQSAKKAQTTEIAKMTNNKLQSVGEAWLFELNMKRLHKSNSNFFLTHEQQVQELQALTEEQKRLQKTHMSIQISEASDSAIKDISKFIRANPKTALLIVQLLRKYQNDKPSHVNEAFLDIPDFEPSASPVSVHPDVDPLNSIDFSVPSTSQRIEAVVHDNNTAASATHEAIVIDDDEEEEEKEVPQRPQIKLAAPPVINRRKEPRGNNIKVDMEEIFRTVLDGTKNMSSTTVVHTSVSPADSNQNKLSVHNSPTHSISSIHSSNSSGLKPSPMGMGPASTSDSPSSAATPPDPTMPPQQMAQPVMHYQNNNPSEKVSHSGNLNPPMDFVPSHPPFDSRPYVSDAVTAGDNVCFLATNAYFSSVQSLSAHLLEQGDHHSPTDILMEAVESSGIVDESPVDEPMASGSQMMMMMSHDMEEMQHDQQEPLFDHNEMGNELFDEILDGSLFTEFGEEFKQDDFRLDDVEINDLLDVLKADSDEKRSSPDTTKKVSYNGTEELNKIFGPSWMEMNNEEQLHYLHVDPLDMPSTSHHNPFEDVFASSSHVGGSQSTSSVLPHSPMITDMSWLREEEVQAALSPQGGPFEDYDFSLSHSL